ncbi:flagellar motor protein MotB [Alkalimarinus sediminis]|uniref:Flagellar motor protein MotB n=1 Tax=Alkalimarinus sediminis TaxID=1632866 RepID=A0A9E8HJF9_9ALTE|nr:flagellar motor protein MotB [Alkalimarinus sediminis]UZW73831.1 flagellar motor protein MotB [Alkalimarinus sediminis]
MSDEEEQDCPECPVGLPAWLATFADLMSLLMCFFVLLLSFSEMDVLKFKRLAGSMREAFGVQNQIDANDIPKGTSIIAQEFSPGKPDPSPLQVVMQHTTDPDQSTLEVLCEAEVEKAVEDQCSDAQGEKQAINEVVIQKLQELVEQTESNAMDMAAKLESEIRSNMVEIETRGRKIVIRVQEKGSFASGSARLQTEFFPVLDKLIELLRDIEGNISVEGHTDNIPINTAQFPSNWDLSVARALEVAHGLFDDGALDQSRFTVTGMADTKPLVPNDTPEGRARNRRVEIILQEPADPELKENIRKARELDAGSFQGDEFDGFEELDPDEIF